LDWGRRCRIGRATKKEGGRAGSPPVGHHHITDGTKGGEGGEAYDSLGSVIKFKKQKVKAEEEDGIRHQTTACIKGPWYLATFLWTRHQNGSHVLSFQTSHHPQDFFVFWPFLNKIREINLTKTYFQDLPLWSRASPISATY
jgi:hypothetical protein